jgi:hypothetical protein
MNDIDQWYEWHYASGRDVPVLGCGRVMAPGEFDIDGKRVERSKLSHPYTYSAFVLWPMSFGKPITGWDSAVYTDRLQQWDPDKYARLGQKHMAGKRWDNATPEQVQAFMREYNDDPDLRMVALQECCNVSNGYPIWILHYKTGKVQP